MFFYGNMSVRSLIQRLFHSGLGVGSICVELTLKRIELARALASGPSLLLLDEPASGLTHSEVAELGGVIRSIRDEFKLTVLLVEHHMGMVMEISDQVVVMEFGSKIAEGDPVTVRANPVVIEAYLGAS